MYLCTLTRLVTLCVAINHVWVHNCGSGGEFLTFSFYAVNKTGVTLVGQRLVIVFIWISLTIYLLYKISETLKIACSTKASNPCNDWRLSLPLRRELSVISYMKCCTRWVKLDLTVLLWEQTTPSLKQIAQFPTTNAVTQWQHTLSLPPIPSAASPSPSDLSCPWPP